jgi:A/G-specific adenine glycosylase
MLQQTQVETVIPYYRRFLARFPDLASLAEAPEDAVLALWSGLGYYARGRNLHAAAKRIVTEHGARFPRDFDAIQALPGIGRSTAAAISAFAFGERRAIMDGNVKRVFCRLFGVDGWPGEKGVTDRLWTLAETLLPETNIQAYTQGIMDLGATLCRRSKPDCGRCPFADDCVAHREGRQSELPVARPRKNLPERETVMLLLLHAGEILLQKRPPSGIWGGLWSLPECAHGQDPVEATRQLGYASVPLPSMPRLSHAFSHFRLTIQPQPMAVQDSRNAVQEPGLVWLSPEEARQAALPTPVRKIIESL